jgi:hypothetical protein
MKRPKEVVHEATQFDRRGRQTNFRVWACAFYLDFGTCRYFDFAGIFRGRLVYRERELPRPVVGIVG